MHVMSQMTAAQFELVFARINLLSQSIVVFRLERHLLFVSEIIAC